MRLPRALQKISNACDFIFHLAHLVLSHLKKEKTPIKRGNKSYDHTLSKNTVKSTVLIHNIQVQYNITLYMGKYITCAFCKGNT